MGAWGTSLYANDTTCDIRGDYVDKLKRGKTNEEVTRELMEKNSDVMGDEEEEPLFWYALADTQWNYGRLLPEVKEKALYFLSQDAELERWRESGQKQLQAWQKTLDTLKKKLESPQPAEKKVYRYRLYQCKWSFGDIFAYRFTSDYSREKGIEGEYVVFRKVSEDRWWPGHIIPVVQIYAWISTDIPSIEKLSGFDLLPTCYGRQTDVQAPPEVRSYVIDLISESARAIPEGNLTFLGNLPGKDCFPYQGYFTGYTPVGWEASKYNDKFEHFVIDQYLEYLKWKDMLTK